MKRTVSPGIKALPAQVAEDVPLDAGRHAICRVLAARANYLAADRPDCQLAAKEICRGCPRLVFRYPFQSLGSLDCYSNTDWAGCLRTRKSTSGGVILLGSHILKTYSSTQPTVSLSSGEAEFYGVVRASGPFLGPITCGCRYGAVSKALS